MTAPSFVSKKRRQILLDACARVAAAERDRNIAHARNHGALFRDPLLATVQTGTPRSLPYTFGILPGTAAYCPNEATTYYARISTPSHPMRIAAPYAAKKLLRAPAIWRSKRNPQLPQA